MHWYWVDSLCIGFGLTLGKLIIKRFVSLRKNQGYSFCNVCRSTLKWTGFCPNLSPHPHVILHAGLAWSCRIHILKSEEKPSPMGRVASQGGWGVWENVFVWPSTNFFNDPPSPGWRGLFIGSWILRLRLWLRAEWQGWEVYCEEWKFSE